MSERAPTRSGSHIVIAMLIVAILTAAGFGYAVGASVLQSAVEKGIEATLGPISFALSPFNLFLYGMISVSIGMAIILGIVFFLSKYDTASLRD